MLTERRAADRIKLAAIVKAVCQKHGASYCALTEGRMIRCEISLDGVRAGIEFDGDAERQLLDNYCVPWNSDKRLAPAFAAVADASVNPHHHMKCTAFYAGAERLERNLDAVLALIASGEGFED